jgi:hypothetical protein
MPEVNAIPKKGVSISQFLSFKADLEYLLKQFPAQKLAEWMKMDKGNLSRKINGVDKTTNRFIGNFNEVMEYPLLLLHQGKTAPQVEEEMERRLEAGPKKPERSRFTVFDQAVGKVVEGMLDIRTMVLELEEKNEMEIGGIKVVLQKHGVEIEELKEAVFGAKDRD